MEPLSINKNVDDLRLRPYIYHHLTYHQTSFWTTTELRCLEKVLFQAFKRLVALVQTADGD